MQQHQYRGGVLVAWCCLVLPALASSFLRPVPSHQQQPALFHGGIRQHNKQGDEAGLTARMGRVRPSQLASALAQAQQQPEEEQQQQAKKGLLWRRGGGGGGSSLWGLYMEALETNPVWTKSWSSGLICALGDVLSQYVAWKAKGTAALLPFTIDPQRLGIFSVMGALYIGPAVHYWFQMLDSLVRKPAIAKRLPKGWGPLLFQLGIDQTVGAAVVNSGFLITLWLTQAAVAGQLLPLGPLLSSIYSKWRVEFWPMLLANWKLWPAANLLNFSLVPLKLRVLFANVVSVAWNMYMSQSANR